MQLRSYGNEDFKIDVEESKADVRRADHINWVDVSGMSDVDEEDKQDINILSNDITLC